MSRLRDASKWARKAPNPDRIAITRDDELFVIL